MIKVTTKTKVYEIEGELKHLCILGRFLSINEQIISEEIEEDEEVKLEFIDYPFQMGGYKIGSLGSGKTRLRNGVLYVTQGVTIRKL